MPAMDDDAPAPDATPDPDPAPDPDPDPDPDQRSFATLAVPGSAPAPAPAPAPDPDPPAPVPAPPPAPSLPLLTAIGLVIAWNGVAGPHLWDVGELVQASVELGGSHAPGQPLHGLVGWAIHLLPLGTITFRLTLLSAACAVLAAWIFGRLTAELAPDAPKDVARVAVHAVAIAVLVAPPVLRQAVRPEVYAPSLLLFALGARALLPWVLGGKGQRGVGIAAFCAGLLFGLHPPHALALVMVGLVGLVRRRGQGLGLSLALGAAGFLSGALVLLYLPLRAAGGTMWGDPTTLSGFFTYVSGAAYRQNLGAGEGSVITTAWDVARYLLLSGGGAAVVALLVALSAKVQRAPLLALTALAALVGALLQPHEEPNPDNVAYVAPALVLFVVAGGVAALELARARPPLGWMLAAALPLAPSLAALPDTLRADAPPLESTAFALADAPSPRAFVLVRTDFVAASLLLSDAQDRARPDLAVMVQGLSTSSWHWRSLAHHPSFAGGVPVRGPGEGRDAWTRGALARAAGVPAFVEPTAMLPDGWLDGFYHRTPIEGASVGRPRDLRARASSGERFASLPIAAIAWMPPGDHAQARDVVRSLALARVERLWGRGIDGEARTTLAAALADGGVDPGPLAALGPPRRPPAPWVRDPDRVFPDHADAIRDEARLLHASGAPDVAVELLAAASERGDPRASLQLAWMLALDGLTAQAESLVTTYEADHGTSETEELRAQLR